MKRVLPFVLVPLAALVACSTTRDDHRAVGTIRATITAVPDGVACVQVVASGDHTVSQSVDVTPGQSTTVQMTAVPLGAVTFTGFAWPQGCAAIAGHDPTWASGAVVAAVRADVVNSVELTLVPVSDVGVGIGFADGGVPDMSAPADLSLPPDLSKPLQLTSWWSFMIWQFGYPPSEQGLTITNSNPQPIAITQIDVPSPFTAIASGCALMPVLAPGQSCDITIMPPADRANVYMTINPGQASSLSINLIVD